MNKTLSIAKKEFSDHVSDSNLLIIYVIVLSVTLLTVYWGGVAYRVQSTVTLADVSMQHGVIDIPGSLTDSLEIYFVTFGQTVFPLLALFGLILSFYSVNGELNGGSLKVALSYPLYRDNLLFGKALGGLLIVSLVSFSTYFIGFSLFIWMTSVALTLDLIMRILSIIFGTVLYTMVFFGLGLLFSIIFNKPLKALTASLGVWVAFNIYWSIIPTISYLLYGYSGSNMAYLLQELGYTTNNSSSVLGRFSLLFNIQYQLESILWNALHVSEMRGVGGSLPSDTMHYYVIFIPFEKILPSLITPFSVLTVFLISIFALCYILFRRKEIT
jgi:ABC-type transport system involved in multi-copper enzyme maturation permease subunit